MSPAEIRRADIRYCRSLTVDDIADMVMDSVVEAADGCSVEPDGVCEHGHRSPLLVLGYM